MSEGSTVLLLQAPVPGPQNRVVVKSSAIAPLGLGYLASVLLQDGFDVHLSDMDIEDVDVRDLEIIVDRCEPAVVGISATTLTFKNALKIAKIVKRRQPRCIVCVGGPHTSVVPEAILGSEVDVVVLGEGEVTFRDLCRDISQGKRFPHELMGTAWQSDGKLLTSARRPRIRDLDRLPYPARHLMPLFDYNIPGTILTSRGCPFACGFCAGPTVLGRQYAARRPCAVVSEVQTCIDIFHLTSFYFVDDTMTVSPDRVKEICRGLRALRVPASLGRELKWTCESRADVVSPDLLGEMRESGCTTIQYGMESGSQQLLDRLGKKISLDQIYQAVVWSREAGISPVLSMVFPHPDETRSTLRDTFRFIRRLYDAGAEKIIPALLTLFPGTRFCEDRVSLGLELLTEDTDEYNLGTPTVVTRYMTFEEIVNGYSQLLILTQHLGGSQIGGLTVSSPEQPASVWMHAG